MACLLEAGDTAGWKPAPRPELTDTHVIVAQLPVCCIADFQSANLTNTQALWSSDGLPAGSGLILTALIINDLVQEGELNK